VARDCCQHRVNEKIEEEIKAFSHLLSQAPSP
jgi:hypothetical protein